MRLRARRGSVLLFAVIAALALRPSAARGARDDFAFVAWALSSQRAAPAQDAARDRASETAATEDAPAAEDDSAEAADASADDESAEETDASAEDESAEESGDEASADDESAGEESSDDESSDEASASEESAGEAAARPDAVSAAPAGTSSATRGSSPTLRKGKPLPGITARAMPNRARMRNALYPRVRVNTEGGEPLSAFEPEIALGLTDHLALVSDVRLSPDHRFQYRRLSDHASFVDDAYLQWKSGRFDLRAGKFEPTISAASGGTSQYLSGTSLLDPEAVNQRLGFSTSAELGGKGWGSHVLSADVFTANGLTDLSAGDFSADDSAAAGRRQAVGLSLVGQQIPVLAGVSYHLGLAYQGSAGGLRMRPADAARGERVEEEFDSRTGNGQPERDYLGGFDYALLSGEDLELSLLTQYLHRDDARGETGGTQNSWMFGTSATLREDFQCDLSYTRRDTHAVERMPAESIARATFGYSHDFRDTGRYAWLGQLGLEVDLSRSREQSDLENSAGFRLTWFSRF